MEITAEMLSGLTTGITTNLGVIVPVGLGIFATLYSVKLIPRIISWFVKG